MGPTLPSQGSRQLRSHFVERLNSTTSICTIPRYHDTTTPRRQVTQAPQHNDTATPRDQVAKSPRRHGHHVTRSPGRHDATTPRRQMTTIPARYHFIVCLHAKPHLHLCLGRRYPNHAYAHVLLLHGDVPLCELPLPHDVPRPLPHRLLVRYQSQ